MVLEKVNEEREEERKEVICLRCGYTWIPYVKSPKLCAKCKSPLWNKERVRNIKTERRAKYRPRSSQIFSDSTSLQKGGNDE